MVGWVCPLPKPTQTRCPGLQRPDQLSFSQSLNSDNKVPCQGCADQLCPPRALLGGKQGWRLPSEKGPAGSAGTSWAAETALTDGPVRLGVGGWGLFPEQPACHPSSMPVRVGGAGGNDGRQMGQAGAGGRSCQRGAPLRRDDTS